MPFDGHLARRALLLVVCAGSVVATAAHRRHVVLSKVHRSLRGVVAPVVESVLIGASANRAVVLGRLPDPEGTIDEVHHFVSTLLENGALHTGPASQRSRSRSAERTPHLPTHVVRVRGGKKVLTRVRFTC